MKHFLSKSENIGIHVKAWHEAGWELYGVPELQYEDIYKLIFKKQ